MAGSGSYIVRLSVRDLHGPTNTLDTSVIICRNQKKKKEKSNAFKRNTLKILILTEKKNAYQHNVLLEASLTDLLHISFPAKSHKILLLILLKYFRYH